MTTSVSLRMDSELKRQAEELFADLGLNMTSAMTMFLRQAVRTQGIPFGLSRLPNAETLEAMLETERMLHDPSAKRYRTKEEVLEALRS